MPASPAPDEPLATRDDLRRLESELAELRDAVARLLREQQVHFTRMAQLQADIDLIRSAWSKIKPPDVTGASYTGPERRRLPRTR